MTPRKLALAYSACALLLLGNLALAGTRFSLTNGSVPQATTDGVGLDSVTACRGSVATPDGGTVMGGTLVPYYYDTKLGWMEGPASQACTLDTTTQSDGGNRAVQICQWTVSARYGRAALVSKNLVNAAGTAISANTRLDCFGIDLPQVDGGAR